MNRPVPARTLLLAAALLALGAAVSLGLARFSYALLLPPMRADLGWRYVTAGAMNTVNAAGYLVGALLMPRLLAQWGARRTLLAGSFMAAVLLAAHAFTTADAGLYALRAATGVASAGGFVAGGLLAARLGLQAQPGSGVTPGLVLGLYYGGTGLGIVACAVLLPPLIALDPAGGLAAAGGLAGAVVPAGGLAAASGPVGPAGLAWRGWQWGWAALGGLAALVSLVMLAVRDHPAPAPAAAQAGSAPQVWRPFAFGLAGYFMFGLGYIGYMTFIVTLLREQGLGPGTVAAFYALLGCGVMASPWLWARLLQAHRNGRPLATLNALLALATALPVLPGLGGHPVVVAASGALFGAVFLSVVASTTALVRHNLPAAQWPAGISAFTVVFAAGQIVGPSVVGWLSDGPGGLRLGLAVSAGALALGALLALRQRALMTPA